MPAEQDIPLELELHYIQQAEAVVNEACAPVVQELAARPTRMVRFIINSFFGNVHIPEVGNNFLRHNIKEWTMYADPDKHYSKYYVG